MKQVIIGVDPHKLSATIEVLDHHEKFLGSGRFTSDQAGYKAMRKYAKCWPDRGRSVVVGTELVVQDTGTLYVTGQRVLFTGHRRRPWSSVTTAWCALSSSPTACA